MRVLSAISLTLLTLAVPTWVGSQPSSTENIATPKVCYLPGKELKIPSHWSQYPYLAAICEMVAEKELDLIVKEDEIRAEKSRLDAEKATSKEHRLESNLLKLQERENAFRLMANEVQRRNLEIRAKLLERSATTIPFNAEDFWHEWHSEDVRYESIRTPIMQALGELTNDVLEQIQKVIKQLDSEKDQVAKEREKLELATREGPSTPGTPTKAKTSLNLVIPTERVALSRGPTAAWTEGSRLGWSATDPHH